MASCLHQEPGCVGYTIIPDGIPSYRLVGRSIASKHSGKASTTLSCLALLVFYLTFVNVGWFLKASANAFAPSSPTWLPHILIKRGNQNISGGLLYSPSVLYSPFFSTFPSRSPHLPPQLLHSLSDLWETWQVPSLLSQTCSTPCTPHHQPLLTHQYPKATAQKQL